jgi:hypothetical protein
MALIGVLDFVKRQTKDSPHDYFDGSWEELVALVEAQWEHRKTSPNNAGVLLIPMPESILPRFYTSTVPVTENTPLQARFAPRVPGEAPFIQVTAPGGVKSPARHVEIILYSHDTLAADGDAPPIREADYYIVSINAYPTENPSPMSPMTMARNFLGLKGGTKPQVPYTAEEFARSIVYWSQHVHTTP